MTPFRSLWRCNTPKCRVVYFTADGGVDQRCPACRVLGVQALRR
jgi:hypothetical protein